MTIVMLWYQHDWGLYGRRYEMIARTWVQEHPGDRLLIVEPPLNPWIWLREFWKAARARDAVLRTYWLAQLRLLFSPLEQEGERLWVLRPFLLRLFRSVGNDFWTRRAFSKAWAQVDRFLKDPPSEETLLWAYPPHAFVRYGVEQWKRGRLCVDLVDDNTQYQSLPENLRNDYKAAYGDLVNKADVIFSVSRALAARHSSMGKKVIHVPNAVSERPLPLKPWKLPPLPKGTRVCYVGRLDERLDRSLLKNIFNRLPQIQFIFVGSFHPATQALWNREIGSRSNVHFLGTIPNLHIPSVLASMDICMLPHEITPLTESMDPLKLYTYLAAKKPVISTGVYMEPSLKPWVKCVDSAPGFEAALDAFLHQAAPPGRPDLSSHVWTHRVGMMAGHLR